MLLNCKKCIICHNKKTLAYGICNKWGHPMKLQIAIVVACLTVGVVCYSSLRAAQPKETKTAKLLREANSSIAQANNAIDHANNSIHLLKTEPVNLVKSQ